MSDKRVNIANLDGRLFLRTTPNRYDIVLIGLSKPSDLSSNRLFTQDFFSLVKKKLRPEGIIALWLPGSITYLSKDLRDLNACILNSLKDVFGNIRIIPGDYNIFLASPSRNILEVDSTKITEKIKQLGLKTNILLPSYLDYRLDSKWLEWFMHSSLGATKRANLDFAPFAVFQMLVFWNRQFSPRFAGIMDSFQNLDLKAIFIIVFLITVLFFYFLHRQPNLRKLSIAYSIATSGFWGMLVNLILIFSFQVFYGYLYHTIGLAY